jgi:hypothetical protein
LKKIIQLIEFWTCRGTKTATTYDVAVVKHPTKHGITTEYEITFMSGRDNYSKDERHAEHWGEKRQRIPYIKVRERGDDFEVTHYKWDHSRSEMVEDRTVTMPMGEAEDLRMVLNVRAKEYVKDRGAKRHYEVYRGDTPPTLDQWEQGSAVQSRKEMLGLIKTLATELKSRPVPMDAYVYDSARPRPPKGWKPDGDDNNCRTRYCGPELCVGDSMKVVLRQIMDMAFLDGLQKHEILALVSATYDEHIEETDDND